MLRVDADALRTLSTSVTGEADRIGDIDPTDALSAAATGMTSLAIGAAAARAGSPIRAACRDAAERLRGMASAAESNAGEYDATDRTFRRQLDALESGL